MFLEIWQSFRSLPIWVQVWVAFILMPVNMASLYFVNEPMGMRIAFLANIGMMLNMPVMLYDRGFSKLMAFPHLIPWSILIAWLIFYRPNASADYDIYLSVLMVCNTISLLFDYADAIKWLKGDRQIAGNLQ
ncbi:MAG: hypothetical protein V3U65_16820 [Granulosicoccaceae bacterium]